MAKVLQFIHKPPICNLCNKPLDLKIAVTDQDGKPVHEECFVLKVREEDTKTLPFALPTSADLDAVCAEKKVKEATSGNRPKIRTLQKSLF
jgi:hypothetical protein